MKTKQRHKYLALCVPYALDQLRNVERSRFEKHLETGCVECVTEITKLRGALNLLPLTLPHKNPSPAVKERLMSLTAPIRPKLLRMRESSSDLPPQRAWFKYGFISAIIVLALSFGLWRQINLLQGTIQEQEQIIGTQQLRLVELKTQLQVKEDIVKVLQAQRIEMVLMNGLQPSPTGYGKIIWDPVKKVAIFQVSNLPTVPSDKDYQLWIIKKKKPISVGVFAVTNPQERESFFKVMDLAVTDRKQIDAFAVTLEPKGGVQQPTGAMYLLGSSGS